MKAIKYQRPGIEMVEVPDVKLNNDDDIKIKVHYASICASDVHIVNGEWDHLYPAPAVIGHEAAGEIVEIGSAATTKGFKVGDLVTYYFNEYCGKCFYCRNGQEHLCSNIRMNMEAMAEYVVVGEQAVHKLPEGIDTLRGCMSEPISVCLHGVDLMQIQTGTTAGIYGAGGLGLLMLQLVKLAGATNITVIEPLAEKREKAKKLGADHVLDPMSKDFNAQVAAVTQGRGFQSIIEVSGSTSGAESALETIGRGGKIVYFSLYPPGYKLPVDMISLFAKEATLCGVFQSPYVFPRVMEILPKIDLSDLTATVFPMDQIGKAWEAQLSRKYPKIVLKIAQDI